MTTKCVEAQCISANIYHGHEISLLFRCDEMVGRQRRVTDTILEAIDQLQ